MHIFRRKSVGESGFTLLELAIVLTIMSVLIAGGLLVGVSQIEQSRVRETVMKIDAIEAALQSYANAFRMLPCPAAPQLAYDDVNSGREQLSAGSVFKCSSAVPGLSTVSISVIDIMFEGVVPVRTLQLPDSYMLDGWGRRFTYAVDNAAARPSGVGGNTGVLPFAPGGNRDNPNSRGVISVDVANGNCSNPATLLADGSQPDGGTPIGALYVVLSHGKNGQGAYFKQGGASRFSGGYTSTGDYENSHFTSAGVDDGSVDQCYSLGTGVPVIQNPNSPEFSAFDDIVRYKARWQLNID